MKTIIQVNMITFIIGVFAVIGIAIKISSWISYKKLEKASANMNETKNNFARRIKLKFENCYKLNLDIKNIPAFVEKYVRTYRQFGVNLTSLQKSLQIVAVLISMITVLGAFYLYNSGVGSGGMYKVLISGIMGELFLLFFELVFDTKEMPQIIKINLEEYLENVYSNRLQLEYDGMEPEPVISEEEIYQRGAMYTAASKVKLRKPGKQAMVVNDEEHVIREIIKEFLC